MADLLAWCKLGEIARRVNERSDCDPLAVVVPPGVDGDVLAAPLGPSQESSGLLVLIARTGVAFTSAHGALAEALREPFSAALENDLRLREMASMCAAAEADKESLLTRLGRKNLGDTVVGANTGLHHVIERVGLVARSDAPVLILGETGTGKEVIARMIHSQSPRSEGPFLRVNCGAIPPELIDSQLFGHKRGAFTGAVESRQGWFDAPMAGPCSWTRSANCRWQPRSACFASFRTVGWIVSAATSCVHVNVRIVAATHRDLAAMVADGQFREDLWYRIAVFPIRLPPLRERPEDIAELARHFAERAATRFVLPSAPLTPEDIQLLTSYPWPGNIRELAAVIDRAAILGNGKGLEVAQALGATVTPPAASLPLAPAPLGSAEFLSLDTAMKQHIESALVITHGRIEGRRGTAALLKINPHTLRARMRKLRIDWAKYRAEDEPY